MLFNAQFEYHICIFEAYYVWNSMVLLTYSVKMTQIKTQMQSKKTKNQTCSGNMKNAFLYHFIFFDTKLRYYSLYQSYSV